MIYEVITSYLRMKFLILNYWISCCKIWRLFVFKRSLRRIFDNKYMAQRLDFHALHIAQQPKTTKPKAKTVDSAFDYLSLADYLSPEQNRVRLNLRKLVDTEITPKICKFVQTATFPHFVLPLLRQQSILEHFSQQSKQKESNIILKGLLIAELARGDPALATLFINTVISIDVLKQIGSETQQQRLLPKLLNFQKTASCGLLENLHLSSLGLKSTKKQNSLILEGQTSITVADNESINFLWTKSGENSLKGLIYEKKKWPEIKVKTETNRFGMRILSQQTLKFQKLQADQQTSLFKNLDLKISMIPINIRLWICWMTAGICIGVYDNTINYASQRIQFNRPISGFQLIQEKLVRLMATTQAIILTCVRMSKLIENGQLTYVKAGLAKGWVCERAREVSRLGRQIYGGNGILHQNYSMRALADLETIYSYGGTNESGLVVAGKQLLNME